MYFGILWGIKCTRAHSPIHIQRTNGSSTSKNKSQLSLFYVARLPQWRLHYNLKFDQIRISHRCLTSLMKMLKVESCIALGVWHAGKQNCKENTAKQKTFDFRRCVCVCFVAFCCFLVFRHTIVDSQERCKSAQFCFFIISKSYPSLCLCDDCVCVSAHKQTQ